MTKSQVGYAAHFGRRLAVHVEADHKLQLDEIL